jgi:hypothetical protein
MELIVIRRIFTKLSTIGDLLIDGEFYCHTLEDTCRQDSPNGKFRKVKGETAIPYGRYEVIINWSNRFQREMPLLLNVPYYTGIRIHAGNTEKDTEGCLLVGKTKGDNWIGNSKSTFNSLMQILRNALKKGKVWVTITDGSMPCA